MVSDRDKARESMKLGLQTLAIAGKPSYVDVSVVKKGYHPGQGFIVDRKYSKADVFFSDVDCIYDDERSFRGEIEGDIVSAIQNLVGGSFDVAIEPNSNYRLKVTTNSSFENAVQEAKSSNSRLEDDLFFR